MFVKLVKSFFFFFFLQVDYRYSYIPLSVKVDCKLFILDRPLTCATLRQRLASGLQQLWDIARAHR